MRCVSILLPAFLVLPGSTAAQLPAPPLAESPVRWSAPPALAAGPEAPAPVGAFAMEAAGATAGSLLGFWLIYLGREGCESEDLQCTLRKAGTAIGVSTLGAIAGDQLASRLADSNPSLLGAVLGAVLGAAAGVGAWHLVTEELELYRSPAAAMVTYSLTQGLITAAGSRLARAGR